MQQTLMMAANAKQRALECSNDNEKAGKVSSSSATQFLAKHGKAPRKALGHLPAKDQGCHFTTNNTMAKLTCAVVGVGSVVSVDIESARQSVI